MKYIYLLELTLVHPSEYFEKLYSFFQEEFISAVTAYNKAVFRNPKKIKKIQDSDTPNSIVLTLSSRERLSSPGKALKKFYTQLLTNNSFKNLLYNERLFYTSDWSEIPDDEKDSEGKKSSINNSSEDIELIKNFIELILDSKCNESSNMKLEKLRKLLEIR